MSKIYIINGPEIEFQSQFFPGGEPHITFPSVEGLKGAEVILDARVRNAQDFLELLALSNALQYHSIGPLNLNLPYFPGARQDRWQGGCFTAKVYIKAIISGCIYDSITIVDPHSELFVTALKNMVGHLIYQPKINIIPAWEFVLRWVVRTGAKYDGIIAPDKGATERAAKVAQKLEIPLIQATKVRDSKTGKLSGFSCPGLDPGKYLVVDDICDGGGTFVGLAWEILSSQDGVGLDLWVSHGIFSKGSERLPDFFNLIGTTDSFYRSFGESLDSHISVVNQIVR